MSSLRNAVKRITHKERSQPQSRTHLGLLEKKKDYKLRAKDYHLKEEKLKAMRSKAELRNPDEFYFGMNRSAVIDGQHTKTNEARMKEIKEIGPDAVRLMKDQDLTYVRMHRQRDYKKVGKMQEDMHFLGVASAKDVGRKHTIFLEDQEDADNFDAAKHFETVPQFVNRDFNRRKVRDMINTTPEKHLEKQAKRNIEQLKQAADERAKSYNELELRKNRLRKLSMAEAHLTTEKLMRCKGKKRKVKDAVDGMPAVYKWRKVRSG